MFAAANRSTGAPCSICLVSIPVEPNTNTTFVLVADLNSRAISSNAGVRSAAAATVTSSRVAEVAGLLSLHAVTHASANTNAASGASRVSSRKIIRRVKVYLRTTHLVSFQNTERRRINVNSDEVLTTDFGISELVTVWYFGARARAGRTFTTRVVTQTLLFLVREDRFPHQALMNSNNTVRAVVIVNRRLLAWAPADHQHLDSRVAANSMAPVIAFLEAGVGLEILSEDFNAGEPVVQLCECWHTGLAIQAFDEVGKRQCGQGLHQFESYKVSSGGSQVHGFTWISKTI